MPHDYIVYYNHEVRKRKYLPKGTEMEETEMTREEFEMLRNLLLLQIRQAIEASSEEERIAKLQELMETIESK